MIINIRQDSVEIEGYVNAIERKSKPLLSRIGHFIERICKGAFNRALGRNDDIKLLFNHDWKRELGSTKHGNLKLHEDNIGLYARAEITDPEVIQKARNGDLVGWSFGFTDRDVETEIDHGMPSRAVKDLDLYEVSILDRTKRPAYEGTLLTARCDIEPVKENSLQFRGEPFIDEVELREEKTQQPKQQNPAEPEKPQVVKQIDYSQAENIINQMKGDN